MPSGFRNSLTQRDETSPSPIKTIESPPIASPSDTRPRKASTVHIQMGSSNLSLKEAMTGQMRANNIIMVTHFKDERDNIEEEFKLREE
jgi:hypothetical protein